jgi:ribose transport system permease protein
MMTSSEGKSSVAADPAASNVRLAKRPQRSLRRDPGLFFMPALLIVSLTITVAIHPQFSDFDLQSLAMGALPLAFAAAAQTVVVISGGIDLSIGSVMAVANVVAASTMEKASFGQSLLLAVAVLTVGAAIGALNGLIVIISRIPDVVATLTSGFIWGGVALVILEKPGGGAPQEFLNLGTGTLFTPWLPNALLLLVVAVGVIWVPLRRSKLGLQLYAVGSDRVAAFRSGVNIDRTRFTAYIFSGLFSAVGGLGLTMTTGIGAPLAGVYYTLSGLAAVVVGGRQPGRRTRRNARAGDGRIRIDPDTDRSDLPQYRSQFRSGDPRDPDRGNRDDWRIRGHGAKSQMTEGAKTAFSRTVAAVTGSGLVSLLRTRTIVALILLLLALVAGIELTRHGTVNTLWVSNMMLFAAPLGIVAAGQTLVMLTGGIDLSVASVATASAYMMATHSGLGVAPAILYGLGVGFVVGLINGIGVALLRVQPLVMTLGTGLMTEGMLIVYSQKKMADAPRVPQFIEDLGAGKFLGGIPNDLIVWVPIAVILIFILRRTGYGRLLYAVGDNSKACTLAGIRVWRILLANYVTCGLLAAAAGLIIVGGTDSAELRLAEVYLLPSVAAVIIGGTSIFGGRGGYSGTIIGALILTVLNSILTLLDVPESVRQILYGAIILLLAAAYTRLTD